MRPIILLPKRQQGWDTQKGGETMDNNANAVSQDGFPTIEDTENQQLTLFNLQEVAVRNTNSIADLKKKIKEATDMYNDHLSHISAFIQKSDGVKELQKDMNQVKNQINKTPEAALYLQKIKDLKYELKEKKQSVSDYALQVMKLSGDNEFEKDGEVFQIQTIAKLVKRKQ